MNMPASADPDRREVYPGGDDAHEATGLAADWVQVFDRFIESGGAEVPTYLQDDAYSNEHEAERDEMVQALGRHFGVDLEEELKKSELARREREAKHGVVIEPWMKQRIGIQEAPDQSSQYPGASAAAVVAEREGRLYMFKEIEMPTRRTDAVGQEEQTFLRFMFGFSADKPA